MYSPVDKIIEQLICRESTNCITTKNSTEGKAICRKLQILPFQFQVAVFMLYALCLCYMRICVYAICIRCTCKIINDNRLPTNQNATKKYHKTTQNFRMWTDVFIPQKRGMSFREWKLAWNKLKFSLQDCYMWRGNSCQENGWC